jgi:hypothetical protein
MRIIAWLTFAFVLLVSQAAPLSAASEELPAFRLEGPTLALKVDVLP